MVKKRKKKSVFFAVTRVLVLFFMGLGVAVGIAIYQINLDTLRGEIVSILENATGLPVQIEGKVSWKLSLRPQIELNKVRIPNAEWAVHKDAFSAEKIDVTLNLVSLFRDRPTIQNVKIYDVKVCVEQNEKGDFSVQPEKKLEDTETVKTEMSVVEKNKYPFEDLGLGGLEVKNLELDFLGRNYSFVGFQVNYVSRENRREYNGWVKSREDVFPFIVSFSEYNAERKVYPVRVAMATGGDALIANIALEGTSKAPIDFIIKGDVPDVSEIGKVFNLNLPEFSLMKVNIMGGFDRKRLTFRNSSIKISGNDAAFSGYIDWSKQLPLINMSVDSKYINLVDLFPNLYSRNKINLNRPLNVFKDIPLFGEDFLKFNLDLHIMADRFVIYRNFDIQDIDLSLNLLDGKARVDTTGVIAGGNVHVAGNIDIDQTGNMHLISAGIGNSIAVGEILSQIQVTDIISDLPVNVEFYVEANGKNLSEWMKTMTGPVKIYSTAPGYAHSALVANMYGTDFLTTLRHSIQDLFRTEKKYNQIKISCVALNTKLRNGLIETQNGAAVETNAINIRFAGKLDLGNENMKLSLATVPVRGLKLSLTGNVVNSMEFTGSLAEPDIKISGAAVAGKVASATGIGLLLAPFTGGIGLVAGAGVGLLAGDLLENWLADDNPCSTALEKGAPIKNNDPEWFKVPLKDLMASVFDNM